MPASVLLSLDFELAWGAHDVVDASTNLQQARWTHEVGAPLLLELLAERELPATWAAVGLLFEERLPAHTDALAPVSYPWLDRGWFDQIPADADAKSHPEWFAPDLLDAILQTPGQDVGFHGYSHVYFDHPGTPASRVEQELSSCRALATDRGFDGHSFIFPRNGIGYLDRLSRHGFAAYRGKDHHRFRKVNLPQSPATILGDVLGLEPRLVSAERHGDLVNIPGSLMMRFHGGWRGAIPDHRRRARLRKGLHTAQRNDGLFHVWLHPINLAPRHPRLADVLRDFLDEVAMARDAGRLEVTTMADIARSTP